MPTSETVLIIPAAGAGTRLQSSTPKVLAEVNGKAMIDHLFARYRDRVRRFVLVVHPSFEALVRSHVEQSAPAIDVTFARQPEPTGMLDAILLAAETAKQAQTSRVWITWCDQVGVHPDTIATLDRLSEEHPDAAAILPTSSQLTPYIHLERDSQGRLSRVRQRREGDVMPETGESDMGLFSLSADAYFRLLPQFGRETTHATGTGERNFLPFLPWLALHGHAVMTFPSTNELEAIGVNTPEDRRRLEGYLRGLESQ